MPWYMVSYDIAQQDREEYEPLWTYLRTKLSGKKLLKSQWLVFHEGPASEVLKSVHKIAKKPLDRLMVQRMVKETEHSGKLMDVNDLEFDVLLQSLRE